MADTVPKHSLLFTKSEWDKVRREPKRLETAALAGYLMPNGRVHVVKNDAGHGGTMTATEFGDFVAQVADAA